MGDRQDDNIQYRESGEVMITAELVRQVADRVYELWRRDLRIEQERRRLSACKWQKQGRG